MPKRRVKRHAVTQPLDPSYKIIALTQGQNTKVTAADFPYLDQWNWFAHWNGCTHSFYAMRHIIGSKRITEMAKEILKCTPKKLPDHKNHDTLDNRRENLRKATHSQNGSNRKKINSNNTSGYTGIRFRKKEKKWEARISHKGIYFHLGLFTSDKKAAHAHDEAAKKLHGEFAHLNFPPQLKGPDATP